MRSSRGALILEQSDYKPGDLPPDGYLPWHEWAEVQRKAGIKQVQCGKCGVWNTPQELSGESIRWIAQSRNGPVEQTAPVCFKCVSANEPSLCEDNATIEPEQVVSTQLSE